MTLGDGRRRGRPWWRGSRSRCGRARGGPRGERGTYTPENETMVLVGEKVVLKDPGPAARGPRLTFHVGDDRILVDGQEEVRTEAVFKRKEPPNP